MHSDTIYTRTSKGSLEIKNRTVKLPRDIGLVFLAVDGKATVADLESRSGMSGEKLHQTLGKLVADGYIKAIEGSAAGTGPAPGPASAADLDFTSPEAVTKRPESAAPAAAEPDSNARAVEERRAALDAQLREQAESRARALAEVRVVAEAEAKAKAVAAGTAASEERTRAESDREAATDPAERAEAEARLRAAATAVARAQAEAKARADAEARARTLAEAKRAAEEAARDEAAAHLKAADEALAGATGQSQAPPPLQLPDEVPQITLPASPPASAPAAAADAPSPAPPPVVDLFEMQQQAARLREAAEAERREREGGEPKFELEPRAQELQDRVLAGRRAREEAPTNDDAASASPRTEPGLEPREPRAQELQDRVLAGQRAREEAETNETAAASPRTELGRESPSRLPDLDIEAGVSRTAPVMRPPPAFPPGGAGLAGAVTDASSQGGAAAESRPPPTTEPGIPVPPPDPEADKKNAEIERAAQADAARARERTAASMKSRVEQQRREREEDARREALFIQMQRRRVLIRNTALTLAVLVAALVACLQFVSLTMFIPGAQQKISARLQEPVTIASLRYPLLPTPRLVVEGVLIGKGRPVKIDALTIPTLPFALLSDTPVFDTVEAKGIIVDPDMLGAIPAWAMAPSAPGVRVNRLLLSRIQIQPTKRELGPFDGDIAFAADGKVSTAALKNEKVTVGLTPLEGGQVRLSLSAREWRPPIGPAVTFNYLDFSGSANKAGLVVNDLQGRIAGGAVNATIAAKWDGPLSVEGELRTENVRLQEVMPAFTTQFLAAGLLQVNGRYSLRSDTLEGLFVAPRIDATFSVARGELRGIDLVRTLQASSGTAFRGGRTPFDEITGTVQIAGGRYSFRQLQLRSGQLSASGALDIAPGGELSGKLNAEVGAKGRVVARAIFNLAGTLQNPVLKQ